MLVKLEFTLVICILGCAGVLIAILLGFFATVQVFFTHHFFSDDPPSLLPFPLSRVK